MAAGVGAACCDWRKALGAGPLEELQAAVLGAAREEHAARPGQSLVTGRSRPLSVHSADGSLLRVPDTPANRAAFGSVGTADSFHSPSFRFRWVRRRSTRDCSASTCR